MVGQKKSTGMGKRSGFLDRDTIAEDRAIQRYNESLEEEARRALRPANAGAPYGERGRGERRGGGRRGPGERPSGPRGPRPPAVEPEAEARLREAAAAAGEPRSLAPEASRLVDRLVGGAKFEVAASAGWDLLVSNRGTEHSPKEWDVFRRDWDAVRQAVGEVWAESHPDDKPAPIKIRTARKRRGGKHRGAARGAAGAAGAPEAAPGDAEGVEGVEGAADDAAAPAADGTVGVSESASRKSRRRRRGGRGRGRRAARPTFVPVPGQVVPVAVVVTTVTPARPARRPGAEEALPHGELSEEALVEEGFSEADLPPLDLASELIAESQAEAGGEQAEAGGEQAAGAEQADLDTPEADTPDLDTPETGGSVGEVPTAVDLPVATAVDLPVRFPGEPVGEPEERVLVSPDAIVDAADDTSSAAEAEPPEAEAGALPPEAGAVPAAPDRPVEPSDLTELPGNRTPTEGVPVDAPGLDPDRAADGT